MCETDNYPLSRNKLLLKLLCFFFFAFIIIFLVFINLNPFHRPCDLEIIIQAYSLCWAYSKIIIILDSIPSKN